MKQVVNEENIVEVILFHHYFIPIAALENAIRDKDVSMLVLPVLNPFEVTPDGTALFVNF
tara:strand:- start:49 stop:228 length:180 start_codon:yes stop_codon:yes gene_type:complete